MIGVLAIVLAAAEPNLELADAVFHELGRARGGALERRAIVDRVAAQQALTLARLPAGERLAHELQIEGDLREAGVTGILRAAAEVQLLRGHEDPARSFVEQWRQQSSSWDELDAATWDGLGLGVATASDGWIVLVAVLVADQDVPRIRDGKEGRTRIDVAALEHQLVLAVNRVRVEAGLRPLQEEAKLAAVARAHSEAMARGGLFGHEGADGSMPRDRVERAGISWRRVAENVQMSRGADDPVASAVESWLDSPGHRENLLEPAHERTGVGVAIDADGAIFFTQLYLEP